MDIKPGWKKGVIDHFNQLGFGFKETKVGRYDLIFFEQVCINLVSLQNDALPMDFISMQEQYKQEGFYFLNLWEDVWYTRKDQVSGRVSAILGVNKRIHGRKTKVLSITQHQADEFLVANHIQSSVGARYKFGLEEGGRLVAVATFSNLRLMKTMKEGYRSAELVRFATLSGYTIIGGFTKLLKHFVKTHAPNDIMTYADRDWSLGKAYEQSGFKLVAVTTPTEIKVNVHNMNRYFPHRLSEQQRISADYVPVFNTGNLKYILYL